MATKMHFVVSDERMKECFLYYFSVKISEAAFSSYLRPHIRRKVSLQQMLKI